VPYSADYVFLRKSWALSPSWTGHPARRPPTEAALR